MTVPTAQTLPTYVPGHAALPPLVHSSCAVCTHPGYAFCGHKYSRMVTSETSTTCVVCAEISNAHDWAGHIWGQS